MALQVLGETYRIRTKLETENYRDIAFVSHARVGDCLFSFVVASSCSFFFAFSQNKTLYNIALIFQYQGSLDRALEFYSETARVERLALGPLSRDLSITYCKYKNTSRKIGLLPALLTHRIHFHPQSISDKSIFKKENWKWQCQSFKCPWRLNATALGQKTFP